MDDKGKRSGCWIIPDDDSILADVVVMNNCFSPSSFDAAVIEFVVCAVVAALLVSHGFFGRELATDETVHLVAGGMESIVCRSEGCSC